MGKETPRTKVLIADDDLEILNLTRSLLRRRPVEILEATDGDEAMRLILENRPALVILDVMMPGQTGWEVCRSIREHDELAETGVIMLTGIGERLNEMTSPLYGADAYLDKPFELDALDEMITRLLNERAS
jgi:DNA-binding response OmpR family regulator